MKAFEIAKNIYQYRADVLERVRMLGVDVFMLFGSDFYLDILSKVSTKTLCGIYLA